MVILCINSAIKKVFSCVPHVLQKHTNLSSYRKRMEGQGPTHSSFFMTLRRDGLPSDLQFQKKNYPQFLWLWVYDLWKLQPTRQFWDSGGVKLESLCNFNIVGCQWTVNCLLGGFNSTSSIKGFLKELFCDMQLKSRVINVYHD